MSPSRSVSLGARGTAHGEDLGRGDDIQGALKQLWTKLVDLSGRNRLLNSKHTPGRSLQSVEGDLQASSFRWP